MQEIKSYAFRTGYNLREGNLKTIGYPTLIAPDLPIGRVVRGAKSQVLSQPTNGSGQRRQVFLKETY